MTYRERQSIEQAFYLLIDGIPHAWFTRQDAASSVTLSGYTKHVGLREPSYEYGIDIREGWYTSSTTNIQIDDLDEELVGLFATAPTVETFLSQNILTETDCTLLTEVHGKHIGLEQFGAAGERHRYPWHPNDTSGHEHLTPEAAAQLGMATARVTDRAVDFVGRRFGIYRTIKQDDGTWLPHPVFSPVKGLEYAELRYWGTMRDAGQVRGRTWTLSLGGPESLLQRTLGQQVLREPLAALPVMTLTAEERHVGCGVQLYASGTWLNSGIFSIPENDLYIWALQFKTASASTEAAVRTALQNAIADALNLDLGSTTPPSTTTGYDDETGISNGVYLLPDNSIEIKATPNKVGPGGGLWVFGAARIVMHQKAWSLLGYQVANNGDPSQGEVDVNDTTYVWFKPYTPQVIDGVSVGAGYYVGTFIGATPNAETPEEVSQGRTTRPFFADGATSWPHDLLDPIDFELRTFDVGTWAIGQHDIQPLDDPAVPGDAYDIQGSTSVSATRLALISGLIRYAGSSEESEFHQVLRTSWAVSSSQSIDPIGIYPMAVGSDWLPTDLYGIDNRNMDRPWATSLDENMATTCTWLSSYSNSRDGFGSQINQVAQRILLSTGTGTGWRVGTAQAYGDEGTLDRGNNDPNNGTPKDVEIADLGLAVPRQLVADADAWKEVIEPMPPILYNIVCASVAPRQADEILRGMTQGLGLCWSLRGGRYGITDPWIPTSTTTADVTIGQSDMLREGGDGYTDVDLRALAPIDKVVLHVRERLTSPGETVKTYEFRATDRGAKYRTTGAEHMATLPWHVPRTGLEGALRTRWDAGFAFWARRHFIARGIKVGRLPGQDIYPGTRLLVTDPWMVSQTGTYGVTAASAIVLNVAVNHDTEVYTIDLMVYDAPAGGQRIMAPEARAVAYDSSTFVVQCLEDFRGAGGTHNDLAAFVKPGWAASLTGNLAIQIKQGTRAEPTKYDTLYGAISSIDLDTFRITLTGALTGGTWRRDAIKLVTIRPYPDQVEWGRRVFYPIASQLGEVDNSTANAVILPE